MKLVNAIKLILTLKCEDSSRLVSEALDRRLSIAERWAVRLHRLGCWSCRRLARQLTFIRDAAKTAGKPAVLNAEPLSDAARSRILDAIRQQGES